MIFIYQKNNTYIKITRIGVVGGEMWQIGTGKWGPRRGKLDMRPGTGKPHAQVLSAEQLMPYLWALSLSVARSGAHTQFTSQRYPH